ncbi:cell wall hydrolase [Aurantimonas sp. Leaf443]|uniref:cell wall hydrolase n=1 Tax=Aurantimonas sp. Leaf443 TaxID=1736378 RepID=UPI000A96CB40|nr:cell wall hydrolase [Aurantimonas sp. Leaf443]
MTIRTLLPLTLVVLSGLSLSACVGAPDAEMSDLVKPVAYGPEQECLARAMYFESNRSSREGMLAVGTVVMNRVKSGRYASDVCSVVAQPRQFAPGVMTREMGAGKELAMQTAAEVLSGKRHDGVKEAMFFHTAGMSFGYNNMHYVAIAGGNAFYEKVSRRLYNGPLRSQSQVAALQKQGKASEASDIDRRIAAAKASQGGTQVALVEEMPGVRNSAKPFLSLFDGRTGRPLVTNAAVSNPDALRGADMDRAQARRGRASEGATPTASASAPARGGRVVLAAQPQVAPARSGGAPDDMSDLIARMAGLPDEAPQAVAVPSARPATAR